jgi:hypothetical protein
MTPIKKSLSPSPQAQRYDQSSATEPELSASSAHPAQSAATKSGSWKKFIAVAAAGLLAASSIIWVPRHLGGSEADKLSAEQVAELTASFQTAMADLPLADLSTPEKRAEVAAALQLPEAETEQILQSAEQGLTRLVWVTVWDNYAEDGDVIHLSSEGYGLTVPIMNAPVTVVLPAPAGGRIRVTGVTDGGGGITVAVKTNSGHIPFPPLEPGQSVDLPVK